MGLVNDIEVKTRELVDERVRQGQALMERVKAIKQWTKEPLQKNVDVAMKIARSFHLTAQMKLLVEIFEQVTSPLFKTNINCLLVTLHRTLNYRYWVTSLGF